MKLSTALCLSAAGLAIAATIPVSETHADVPGSTEQTGGSELTSQAADMNTQDFWDYMKRLGCAIANNC